MSWFFSVRLQLGVVLTLCVAGTLAIWWFMTNHTHSWWLWLAHWLLVVNLVAFIYYGVDKMLAIRRPGLRIPEAVLHTLSAVGGSPGALLAMWLFRHKTVKASFRILFWGIVVLQLALVTFVIVKLLQRE